MAGDRRDPHRSPPLDLRLIMAPGTKGLSEMSRFLFALGAGLLFSLACLGAAIHPSDIDCEGACPIALDCPARL